MRVNLHLCELRAKEKKSLVIKKKQKKTQTKNSEEIIKKFGVFGFQDLKTSEN